MSKASENRFFGTIYFDYNSRPDGFDRMRQFFQPEHGLTLFGPLRSRHLRLPSAPGSASSSAAGCGACSDEAPPRLSRSCSCCSQPHRPPTPTSAARTSSSRPPPVPTSSSSPSACPTSSPASPPSRSARTGAPVTGIRHHAAPAHWRSLQAPAHLRPHEGVSADDPAFFTGSVWMMASGSLAGPLRHLRRRRQPAPPPSPSPPSPSPPSRMDRTLGTILAVLGIFLILTMAGVVAAAIRESRLPPGLAAQLPATVAAPSHRHGRQPRLHGCSSSTAEPNGGTSKPPPTTENIYPSAPMTPLLTGNRLDLTINRYDPRAISAPSAPTTTSSPTTATSCTSTPSASPAWTPSSTSIPRSSAAGHFRLNLPSMPARHLRPLRRHRPRQRLPRNPRRHPHRPHRHHCNARRSNLQQWPAETVNSDDASALTSPISRHAARQLLPSS